MNRRIIVTNAMRLLLAVHATVYDHNVVLTRHNTNENNLEAIQSNNDAFYYWFQTQCKVFHTDFSQKRPHSPRNPAEFFSGNFTNLYGMYSIFSMASHERAVMPGDFTSVKSSENSGNCSLFYL